MTTVYIVRHCEAEGNVQGVFQGSTDFAVSQKGIKQLDKLAERFKSIPLDVVYSSPLKRAYCTAEAGVRYSRLPIICDDGLVEINGGKMEGKPWNKLNELFPDEYSAWNGNFADFSPPDGESVRDVYERITKTFINIVSKNKSKSIGIFSHGCAIRILMCYIKGIPLENIDDVMWCDNTAINCIKISESGKIAVEYENDYTHIKNDAETAANHMWWGEQNAVK